MPWSRSSNRGVGSSKQDNVGSHFTGRSQEVLIRVSSEAGVGGWTGGWRVEGGEWCGCQGDVKKPVWQRDTHVRHGGDQMCSITPEVSGMGGRSPSQGGWLVPSQWEDGACSSRAERVAIARAGMWHGLPKATPLGSEPLEVERGVGEVLGDKSIWPRSRALPRLWG